MAIFHVAGLNGPNRPADPLAKELNILAGQFRGLDFNIPAGVTSASLIVGIGGALISDQLPSITQQRDISIGTRTYFSRTVQPELQALADQGDARLLGLAGQLGRTMAVGYSLGRLFEPQLPLEIAATHITVDNQSVAFTPESGHVVEYGLGVNGLFSHIKSVQAGRYVLTGLHKSRAEAAILRGITDYNGLGNDSVRIRSGGIQQSLDAMLKAGTLKEGEVDLIVASRVHEAGADLRYGLQQVPDLLHAGGQVIARGPRGFKKGMGYDEVHRQISAQTNMTITTSTQYTRVLPNHTKELNRLIVAEKVQDTP